MHFVEAFIMMAMFAMSGGTAAADIVESNSASVQEICSVMPLGAIILRPNSCTNWVQCPTSLDDSSSYEEGTCVFGLYYDKNSQRCTYMDNVQCPYETVERVETNRCATQVDGTFLPVTDNCNAYVFCQDRREMRSACPSNLLFNPAKSSCVYSNEYECKITATTTVSPICRSIKNDQPFANENYCGKYHKCINETLYSYDCDAGTAFDYLTGNCLPKQNATCLPTTVPENTICGDNDALVGYFPDNISCSGYYICEKQSDGTPDRNPKHMKCDTGYFFDSEKWSCRDRLSVPCQLDRCEDMGSKYVNVAGNCTAYARCSDGKTVSYGKCPDKYYFDERTQGCTVYNINYAACAQ